MAPEATIQIHIARDARLLWQEDGTMFRECGPIYSLLYPGRGEGTRGGGGEGGGNKDPERLGKKMCCSVLFHTATYGLGPSTGINDSAGWL